jgi:hypothetical protein
VDRQRIFNICPQLYHKNPVPTIGKAQRRQSENTSIKKSTLIKKIYEYRELYSADVDLISYQNERYSTYRRVRKGFLEVIILETVLGSRNYTLCLPSSLYANKRCSLSADRRLYSLVLERLSLSSLNIHYFTHLPRWEDHLAARDAIRLEVQEVTHPNLLPAPTSTPCNTDIPREAAGYIAQGIRA